MSILNLEAELDCPWPAGMSNRTKPTSKRTGTCVSRTTRGSTGWLEGRVQLRGEPTGTARLLQDMAIEDIEKFRPEIDHRPLCDPGFLSDRDVLISSTERARTGQSSRLIAKRERTRRGKGVRVEERRSERIQIPTIRLFHSGSNIHARAASEVTSSEQDVTRCTRTRGVDRGRQPGLIS
jgi:hypothetical protein